MITAPVPDESAQVADPAKLLRLGSMIKGELDELHAHPLDDAGRARLLATLARAVAELEAALPAALRTELGTVAQYLRVGVAVSDAELRIAHAQLVGWLEGLFQGVQFATAVHHGIPPSTH
ncbi:proteasome activator [Pseudonocardia sp. CA-107938]|uniref:proteasome activator n=1 Tax=Pseudonocardia sp. CA-107938 TaxID=3240021 RepID=UPI003D92720F